MFVHPRQLDRVLAGEAAIARYQAVVTAVGHSDLLTVRLEPRPGVPLDRERLSEALAEAVKLRLDVVTVPEGTIADGASRVVDARENRPD